MAKVLPFQFDTPSEVLEEATCVLNQGGVLAVGTESFYALSASAFSQVGVERVKQIKGRHDHKPLLVLIGEFSQVFKLVPQLPSAAIPLIETFWPGPLTLVVPALSTLPEGLIVGTGTIGVRQPGHSKLLRLLQESGPLTGTSANRSGDPPAQTASEVDRMLGNELDLILDSGPTPGGFPSTLVNLSGPMEILREGPISRDQIQEALARSGFTLVE